MKTLTALVIGNADYEDASPLRNSVNDAEDIAKRLRDGGFGVTKLTDASSKDMHKALKKFKKISEGGDVALFFFAGHGVQIDGVNYLAAVDTPVDDEVDVKHGSLSLDRVIDTMKSAEASTNIIILDACRDNPWDRKWRGGPRGLAPVYAPRGTLIGYATSPGEVASDGSGRNGAYTSALLQHIDAPDVPIEAMFKRVRNTLSANTKQKQTSWEHTSLSGEFFFNLSAAARIDEYGATAIKDRTFVLDESKLSHHVIGALKSINWYSQNPALEKLSARQIAGAHPNSLFVLGRNILQAAHGSANAAIDWIVRFCEHTKDMKAPARKAVLDGILFEIFFDSDGKLRDRAKANVFNEVFALQEVPELQGSFEFIAAALAPEAHRFFALPGKGHSVSVDVVVDKDLAVESVFVGGKDVLTAEDGFLSADDKGARIHRRRQREQFENDLVTQMLVPRRLLTVTYNKPVEMLAEVKFPYGYEVTRPT
jgi:hypothetical protein